MPAAESGIQFSVVVPSYNYGKGLLKLVDYFAASGRHDYELIIVDDGSKDDTQAIFSAFKAPQVKYFRKENGERGAARNYGADRARGRYICFFDQDDFPFPTFLDEAASCIEKLKEPMVFCVGMEVRDQNGNVLRRSEDLPDPLNSKLLRGNLFGCGGIFLKREVLAEVRFKEERGLVGTEDWLFKLQVCARHEIRYWGKVCWAYIDTGNNSVYRFSEADLNSRAELLVKHLRADPVFMEKYGAHLTDIEAMRSIYTALHLALAGKIARPFQYLGKAFLKRPAGLLRPATLGTAKNVLRNILGMGKAQQ